MLDAVRRYATRVLLLHLGLLILVVSFVLLAARQVRTSARQEALTQSMQRLQTLADQTARGLEAQYVSILSDLNVILRPEPATAPAPATASAPATQEAAPLRGRNGGAGTAGGRGRGAGRGVLSRIDFLSRPLVVDSQQLALLWRQLQIKGVSQIFLVNLDSHQVALSYPESARASAMALTREHIDWMITIKDAQMSPFQLGDGGTEGSGFHLIAVSAAEVQRGGGGGGGGANPDDENPGGFGTPPGGPGRPGGRGGPGDPGAFPGSPGAVATAPTPGAPQFAVVVVVPIDNARERFLDRLNSEKDHENNAILVDDAGQVLVSNNLLAVGTNLLEQLPASLRPVFTDLLSSDEAKSQPTVIDQPIPIGGNNIPPQVIAAAQFPIAASRHWSILVSSPLADAETLVNTLFSQALAWAVFVSLAVTGILISTSVFLIRARIGYERTRHEMLTRELQQARHIQLAWLPDLKSVPAGIEVSAANLPASHISGDFYNWFPLPSLMQKTGVGGEHPEAPSGKIAIVIGDVTGHGMAAAFLMATTQLLVRMTLSRYQDAGRCLKEVNKQLCVQSREFKGQFVTMLVMVLDTQHNTLQVASAGHPTPLIASDGFRPLELEPQLVLGVNPDEEYHAKTFRLEPGAAVVLYTDGVVEARSAAGTQYGLDNLLQLLRSQKDEEPAARIHAILNDVKRFCDNRELLDDVTLVALRTAPVAARV